MTKQVMVPVELTAEMIEIFLCTAIYHSYDGEAYLDNLQECLEAMLEAAPQVEGDHNSIAMCPSNCGCLLRDNSDGAMSLYGPNSESCDVCEHLPLIAAELAYRDAEIERLRAENAELKDMVAEAKRKLYPRLWSEAEREAWHKNIPDVEKAFEALREASND